jgi:hypothetical protein
MFISTVECHLGHGNYPRKEASAVLLSAGRRSYHFAVSRHLRLLAIGAGTL